MGKPLATINLEPDTIFIVEGYCPLRGMTWVECNSAESAYAARWQISKDIGMQGAKIRIINVITDTVVFST